MKTCNVCTKQKDKSQFYKAKRSPDGLQYTCKVCSNKRGKEFRTQNPRFGYKYLLRTKYKMTLEDINTMLDLQGFCCAICHQPQTPKRRLVVDHCHTTGRVRSLLCDHCNHAIGAMGDNPDRLRAAAMYVEKYAT